MIRSFLVALAMFAAIAMSIGLTPRWENQSVQGGLLESTVPSRIGEWIEIPNQLVQVNVAVNRDDVDLASQLYDEVLSRSYRNPAGEIIMLSMAYGRRQRQELKVHRPELCYLAQGFSVGAARPISINLPSGSINAREFVATASNRRELVTYWIRIGDRIVSSPTHGRMFILAEGLKGRVPDGLVIRVSQVVSEQEDEGSRFALQHEFVAAFIDAVPSQSLTVLAPTGISSRVVN